MYNKIHKIKAVIRGNGLRKSNGIKYKHTKSKSKGANISTRQDSKSCYPLPDP